MPSPTRPDPPDWMLSARVKLRELSPDERKHRRLELLGDPDYRRGQKLFRSKSSWLDYSSAEQNALQHHHAIGLILELIDDVDAEALEQPTPSARAQMLMALQRAAQ